MLRHGRALLVSVEMVEMETGEMRHYLKNGSSLKSVINLHREGAWQPGISRDFKSDAHSALFLLHPENPLHHQHRDQPRPSSWTVDSHGHSIAPKETINRRQTTKEAIFSPDLRC